MSDINFLEKLLDGVNVDWRSLWEVTIWDKKFNAVERHKQELVNRYHYFLAKEINELVVPGGTVKLLTTNVSDKYTTEALASDKISSGEIVAIPWGGDAIVQYYNGDFLTSDNRIATSSNSEYLSNKYLYYFLLNNIAELRSYYRGSGIKHPSMYDVLEMKIPIPSLKIQAEIVRILDAFTTHTAELTAELTARKKQYNYYRDKLLSFEDGEVEWKSLDEITTSIASGRNKVRSPEGAIPVYGSTGLIGFTNDAAYSGDVLLIARVGANAGLVNAIAGNYDVSDNTLMVRPIETWNIRFAFHQFDILIKSITEGLPREIELRQKQYEYYRDLLLSFPKPKEAAA